MLGPAGNNATCWADFWAVRSGHGILTFTVFISPGKQRTGRDTFMHFGWLRREKNASGVIVGEIYVDIAKHDKKDFGLGDPVTRMLNNDPTQRNQPQTTDHVWIWSWQESDDH